MWKKYGFIFIGTYLSVYASTLVSIFFLGKWYWVIYLDIRIIMWSNTNILYFIFLVDNDIITASLFGFESNEDCIKRACDMIQRVFSFENLPNYVRENHRVGVATIGELNLKITLFIYVYINY
jgi:hypothetical protein